MNSTSSRPDNDRFARHETTPDVNAEIIRHRVDLRIHAAIMIANAALAIYCIYRFCEPENATAADEIAALDPPSGWAMLAIIAVIAIVAALCLIEGGRCLLKSSALLARRRRSKAAAAVAFAEPAPTRNAPNFLTIPRRLAGWHSPVALHDAGQSMAMPWTDRFGG